VQDAELEFTPGTRFQYSNSDNIVIGLMIEAATGRSYEAELAKRVFTPMGLARTSLPSGERIAPPLVHGYEVRPPEPPDNISELFAAGWTWASGGILSTPFDADRFIRAYARGAGISAATRAAQLRFVPGSSEPPGPGQNAAGLAIFRYRTTCGTVYGHTGNTAGYTQFVAASRDGSRSTVVSVNAQITPSVNGPRFVELRHIYTLAVCAALAR
jgi:D-alanyl-D-alanine carboxypeptidase